MRIYKEVYRGAAFENTQESWDSKRQFVVSSIKTKPVIRQRTRDGTRKNKSNSHNFSFNLHHREEVICKTFFLNTLSISETFVALKKPVRLVWRHQILEGSIFQQINYQVIACR